MSEFKAGDRVRFIPGCGIIAAGSLATVKDANVDVLYVQFDAYPASNHLHYPVGHRRYDTWAFDARDFVRLEVGAAVASTPAPKPSLLRRIARAIGFPA